MESITLYSRIRILKDAFYKEINDVCHNSGFDFEAKSFALFQLLFKKEKLTINQIARELKQSHVSIVHKVDELKRKHLVLILTDDSDHRRKQVKLSQYGRNIAIESQNTWYYLNQVTNDLLDEHAPGFIEMINKLEKSLKTKSIDNRIKEYELKENSN